MTSVNLGYSNLSGGGIDRVQFTKKLFEIALLKLLQPRPTTFPIFNTSAV